MISLKNNIDALIISDPNTSKCGMSVSVDVGSFYDGNIHGLAHFCEHMLFLGSKTYPEPGYLEDYLSSYFGKANAFTSEEKTVFYFELSCDGLTKAVEIFSRMFYEPNFDEKHAFKEIHAINSEHEKNLNSDSRKLYSVMKLVSNPQHPFYSNFGTGNEKTLNNSLHLHKINLTSLFILVIKFFKGNDSKLKLKSFIGNDS